jgi:hypothetical protein
VCEVVELLKWMQLTPSSHSRFQGYRYLTDYVPPPLPDADPRQIWCSSGCGTLSCLLTRRSASSTRTRCRSWGSLCPRRVFRWSRSVWRLYVRSERPRGATQWYDGDKSEGRGGIANGAQGHRIGTSDRRSHVGGPRKYRESSAGTSDRR